MVPVENREGPGLLSPKGRAAETEGGGAAGGGRHPPRARVPWLLLSEIFPGGIRGRAMALTSSMNWGINLLISLTFLTVTDLIGLPWVCFIYAIMSLASLVFVVVFIPETKGCSLEQISVELAKA
ncbi:solute carrier family 2, facilitated glucose transporter member 12-like [Leptonychotes weddellii]|uniref:Solute carrier family 2, facilitated glucose transporter member 12-like n=1 Tax=Leptonychotes weddellii TaxID=9713 RepID=A0A7F8RDH4_LEPWE|nr:solute carrier family 2, facilitated glucose transporter member 12-like [Leptonychotes weddellii]